MNASRYRVKHYCYLNYYFVYSINILITTFVTIFRRFPSLFRKFSRPHIRFPAFSETFRRFPRITEYFRRRSRNIGTCFDHTPLDLSDISEAINLLTSDDMENTPPESWIWFRMNFTSDVFFRKTLVLL